MDHTRIRGEHTTPVVAGLIVATLLAAAWLGPHTYAQQTYAQQTDDPALLRQLAERLLGIHYPAERAEQAQILPGRLPEDLPLSVPIAPGGRLIGSVVQPWAGQAPVTTIIVLDAPGDLTQAFTFYRQAFESQAWTAAPPGGAPVNQGGFVTSYNSQTTYCKGAHWAMLTATPLTASVQDVRIRILSGTGPCTVNTAGAAPAPPGAHLIPRLSPPEGVVLLHPAGSVPGRPGGWTSEAIALTDEGTAELEAFFAQQLQASGWSKLAGDVNDAASWSLWEVPGEGDWQGFLVVLNGPGQNRRLVIVRVDSSVLDGARGN